MCEDIRLTEDEARRLRFLIRNSRSFLRPLSADHFTVKAKFYEGRWGIVLGWRKQIKGEDYGNDAFLDSRRLFGEGVMEGMVELMDRNCRQSEDRILGRSPIEPELGTD